MEDSNLTDSNLFVDIMYIDIYVLCALMFNRTLRKVDNRYIVAIDNNGFMQIYM